MDRLDVIANGMISEWIDPESEKSTHETAQLIHGFPPPDKILNLTFAVEIDLPAAMAIAKPYGRHTSDDVVVIDPSIVIDCDVIDVPLVSNARTAEREESGGSPQELRKNAATRADRRHRTAERMPREPKLFRAVRECTGQMRPEIVHLSLETTMHTSNSFRQVFGGVYVSPDIIPILQFSTAERDYTIVCAGQDIRLGTVSFDELDFAESQLPGDVAHDGIVAVRQPRQFGKQKRLTKPIESFNWTV